MLAPTRFDARLSECVTPYSCDSFRGGLGTIFILEPFDSGTQRRFCYTFPMSKVGGSLGRRADMDGNETCDRSAAYRKECA